jgi:uncharacterized SAM-binding protein YcdF (DUF218 family)
MSLEPIPTGWVPAGLRPDVVVVLGAEVFGPGRPSAAVARRIAHGAAVWRRLEAEVLVVSGGVGQATVSEAAVMAVLAAEMGVPPEAIVLEESSHSTLEQAVAVTRLARDRGWESAVVVSDRFHVPRARFLFRRMGLEAAGAPAAGPGEGSRRKWLQGWVREGAAWVKVLGQWAGGSLRRAVSGVETPLD